MIQGTRNQLGILNILVLVLSAYVLAALFIDTTFKLPKEISELFALVDSGICFIFLIDFIKRFYQAESKLKFMRWGWIDLLSSIPTLDIMRVGRFIRLVRLLRILRAFRSVRELMQHIFRSKIQGTFSLVSVTSVLVVIFSSIAILQVEDDPNSNIKTAEDALWWAYATVTTVGYGDKYPVTTEGRIIASLLMTVGVGLFGTFTAFVAAWFVTVAKDGNIEEVKESELAAVNNNIR